MFLSSGLVFSLVLARRGRVGPGGAGPSPTDATLSLQADLCIMTRLLGYVDLSEPHFVAAVLAIVFNPLFWNVVSAPRVGCMDGQVDGWTD